MDNNEQILTDFMRAHYTDERLSWLLAHAESGKLAFASCCCFIGITTSDHQLRGEFDSFRDIGLHLSVARELPGADAAEKAYKDLCDPEYHVKLVEAIANGQAADFDRVADDIRVAKLIPLIKSEMSRRESSRSQVEVSEVVMV